MPGDLLRGFKLTAVLHISSNAGRPEGVIADLSFDPCGCRSALDHAVSVLLPYLICRQTAFSAGGGAKRPAAFVFGDAGGRHVLVDVAL